MKTAYQEMFDEVRASERLRREVWNMTKTERKRQRRLPKAAVIAAALVLALTGTTLAAVGVPGTFKGWFVQQWAEMSRQEISEEQLALIDQLTQQVGVSDTSSGVTVTLDSVTGGDSTLWLLLKVDQETDRQEEYLYNFRNVELEFTPDPDQVDTPGGYGHDYAYVGVAEDGMLTLLMRYTIDLTGEASLLQGCQADLHLKDLLYGDSVIQEGEWDLAFALEPTEQTVLTLEQITVPARDDEKREETTVELRDVRVSATGIRYTQAAEDQMLRPLLEGLALKDGTVVSYSGGAARWTDETEDGRWASDFYWQLPVDLSQVAGVRFDHTVIPLHE